MDFMDIAKRLLLVHEGNVLTEYRCTAGHRTIGVGWNIDAKPLPKGFGKVVNGKLTITQAEADDLLNVSMREHWEDLVAKMPWVQRLDDWRKAAMLDLAFNMGIPTLLKFTNTLGYLHAGKYILASNGLKMSRWAKQVQKQRVDTITEIVRTGTLAESVKKVYGV